MSSAAPVQHILLVIAMESEAAPLLNKLQLKEIPKVSFLPAEIYQGEYNKTRVSVITNGKDPTHKVDNVGTTPAAVSTFAALEHLKPDIVINCGTAGGFRRAGASIGDAFVSTASAHHDRRIPIPGFKEYGTGLAQSFACPNLIKEFNFKSGLVSTSNSLDHSEIDDVLMTENNAAVKDMEAAAIAWICGLANVPFFAVKVVTDIVDGDRTSQEEFLENLHTAAESLRKVIPEVIEFVAGRSLSDL